MERRNAALNGKVGGVGRVGSRDWSMVRSERARLIESSVMGAWDGRRGGRYGRRAGRRKTNGTKYLEGT